MTAKAKKGLKITGLSLLLVVLLLLTIVLGYVTYLSANYYRISDYQTLVVNNNKEEILSLDTSYSISTYNIGFGAYDREYDFFMDSGEMLDGTKVTGTRAKAESKESVLENTNGAINIALGLNTDFAFFQEVDTASTRSYFVNQYEMLENAYSDYSSSFASNFHTGYLLYPFNDPIGSIKSGIATFSKYKIEESVRRSFPIDESFVNKFFDLDRCFVVNRLNIDGTDKQLVLINLHMSAYDEGGKIRAKQLDMLTELISYEYRQGNYVIAGGDWNHDIADSIGVFPSEQKTPAWVQQITAEDIPEGFSFAKSLNAPTCRAAEMPYTEGVNYTVVIDGFLVSDNVRVEEVTNIAEVGGEDVSFLYSDHNAVKMSFSLITPEIEEPTEPETPEIGGGENTDNGNEGVVENIADSLFIEDKKKAVN